MTSSQAMRNRYVKDAVSTVSPAQLVTMMYERLVRDLVQAEQALAERDLEKVNDRLCHAQEIVIELSTSLDTSKWSGGPALAQLYEFILDEMIAANIEKNRAKIRACIELVTPLHLAWQEAALGAATDVVAEAAG